MNPPMHHRPHDGGDVKRSHTDPGEERRYVEGRIREMERHKQEDPTLWVRNPACLARIDAELKRLRKRRNDLLQGVLL